MCNGSKFKHVLLTVTVMPHCLCQQAAIKEDDAKSADAILSSQQPSTDRLINKRDSIESKVDKSICFTKRSQYARN